MEQSNDIRTGIDIEHRRMFNVEAFGTTFEVDADVAVNDEKKRRKRIMTKKEYDETIRLVLYWDVAEGHIDPATGVHITQKELRTSCKKGWRNKRKYYNVVPIAIQDGESVNRLYFQDGRDGEWKIVLHHKMVFGAIEECHVAVGHKKVKATWERVSKKYYDASEDLCRIFIDTCPVCNTSEGKVFVPPSSSFKRQFRDRFTACLLDYSDCPVVDVYGDTMKFLLVLHDDATKFTVLRPIRDDVDSAVEYELSYMFGMLGFPKKQFTAEEESWLKSGLIENTVKKWEPACNCKSGVNKRLRFQVKEVIYRLLKKELHDQGYESESDEIPKSNWVTVIPAAMMAINNASYPKVFGMKSSSGIGSTVTVQVEDFLDEKDIESADSIDDKISVRTTVNNDEFMPPIVEVTQQVQSVNVALVLKAEKCQTTSVGNQLYRIAYPHLLCATCAAINGPRLVSVAEEAYYDCFLDEKRWWTAEMIATFGILKAHEKHREDTIFVDSGLPTMKSVLEYDETNKVPRSGEKHLDDVVLVDIGNQMRNGAAGILPEKIKKIVTVAYKNSHFVVLEMRLKDWMTVVYDGWSTDPDDLRQWVEHEEYVLSRYAGISKKDSGRKWNTRYYKSTEDFYPQMISIKQEDDYNCGPIACRVLWEVLAKGEIDKKYPRLIGGRSEYLLKASSKVCDWRKICILELKEMLGKFTEELLVQKRDRRAGKRHGEKHDEDRGEKTNAPTDDTHKLKSRKLM